MNERGPRELKLRTREEKEASIPKPVITRLINWMFLWEPPIKINSTRDIEAVSKTMSK